MSCSPLTVASHAMFSPHTLMVILFCSSLTLEVSMSCFFPRYQYWPSHVIPSDIVVFAMTFYYKRAKGDAFRALTQELGISPFGSHAGWYEPPPQAPEFF